MKKLLLTTALVAFAGVAHAHDHIPTTTSIGNTVQFGSSTTHGTTTTAGLDVRRDADSTSALSVDSGTNTTTVNGALNSTGDTTLGTVNEYGEGVSDTTVNGDLTIVNGDGEETNVGTAISNNENAIGAVGTRIEHINSCLLYTSPSPRDRQKSRMPSSA